MSNLKLCASCVSRDAAERFWLDEADPNCSTCRILTQTLAHFYPPSGPHGKILLLSPRSTPPTIQVSGSGEDASPAGFTFYTKTENDARALRQSGGDFFDTLGVGRDIDKSPFTEPTLDLIRNWDLDCLNSHVKCRESLPKLPSRVIDVKVRNGKCKLVETKGASGRYMTLSHCWGTLRILTTVKENIDTHRQGIDLKALPKTFQDAIWMTERLGIQYLWIDSLCIVQNDADDWARESALMAAIYSNSHLTLAATASKNGSEGLFKERAVDTFSVTVPGPPPLTVSVMRRREHECLLNIDEESVDYFEDSLPLNTRAWVYQERLLSPRFLHFSTDELVWECRQLRACECARVPQPRETENRSVDTPDRLFFQLPDAEKYWYQLIKKYTQLKITKEFDRLPAVSGIARRLMSAENYMAGLRKSHAISDLSWLTTSVKSKRPSVYQAPSWSWASVMGPIIYTSDIPLERSPELDDIQTHILEISAHPATPNGDRFGRVKGGQLRISGRCFDAVLRRKDQKDILGSTFGGHWLRIEIPQLDPKLWPPKILIDDAVDAQESVDRPVVLLTIPMRSRYGIEAHFIILTEDSRGPKKLRRLGIITRVVFSEKEIGLVGITAEGTLWRGDRRELTIV